MTLETHSNPIPDYQRSAVLMRRGAECGDQWVVIGSAPGAVNALNRLARPQNAGQVPGCLIGCNDAAGLAYLDALLLHDSLAARMLYPSIDGARFAGTIKIATESCLQAVPPIAAKVDEVFALDRAFVKAWQPGRLCNPMASGAICAQLAVLHGARQITLVGMTGYRSTRERCEVDYDNGRLGTDGGVMNYYAPFMRSLITQTPEIEWTSMGRPLWLDPDQRLFNFHVTEIPE